MFDRDLFCIDGTNIRASKSAAGALEKRKNEPGDHALGRSQGGFGTKLHVVTDSNGIPIEFLLSPGQAHKSRYMCDLLERIGVLRNVFFEDQAKSVSR